LPRGCLPRGARGVAPRSSGPYLLAHEDDLQDLHRGHAGLGRGLPEGTRGIFVGGGGSVRISRLIGVSRMTDMMLTGRVFDADEGQDFGISNYLVGEGEGVAKALALA
jgi:hypothetical protein